MAKLVVLSIFDADCEGSYPVVLEIANEGEYPFAEADGRLPAASELLKYYKDWQYPYTQLVSSLRSGRIGATGHTVSVSEIKTASHNLKKHLNLWLDSPQMQKIDRTLLRSLKDESEAIRFIIKTKNPDLQRLPWHLWDDFFYHYRRAEVSFSLPVRQRRQVKYREKTKILAVFGTQQGIGSETRIDLDKDWQLLQKNFSACAELIKLDTPSLEELYDELEKHSPDLFFFAGHSATQENGEKGQIELNDSETITIEDLKHPLQTAVENGLQLAIFNSCDGLGIAKELAYLNIPQIMVMREPVPDVVAQKFLQRFLEAFIGENSVCFAVRQAREKISALEPKFPGVSWLPIVFQNPAEQPLTGKLFRRDRNEQRSPNNTDNSTLNSPEQTIIPNESTLLQEVTGESRVLAGRYRIVELLTSGGFGTTYLAEDSRLPGNRKCLIKRLNCTGIAPETWQEITRLFDKEAEILEQLGDSHSQIPKLLAYFEEDQEFYLVQELIEGEDLSKEILPGKKMDESYVSALLRDVLQILEFLHQHSIIHRDIKPSNLIRRQQDNKLVLIDFGAVKQISGVTLNNEAHPVTSAIVGTSGYLPPEQLYGQAKLCSDIYALGVLCIEALTGVVPHQLERDPNTQQIIWRDRVEVSSQLGRILDKMVKADWQQRYQSATEVLEDLRRCDRNRLVTIESRSESTSSLQRIVKNQHNIKLNLFSAFLAVVLLGSLTVIVTRSGDNNKLPPTQPNTAGIQ